ncbi:MAG: heme lyase CcmF/NrfE family subunit [bacterium]
MAPEIGLFTLILAFMLALLQSVLPLWGAHKGNIVLMRLGNQFATGQFLFILLAFVALVYCFLTSDFSVRIVAENSHTAKPLLYKFAGTWGNHEGSMLLWVLILALFGWCVALFGRDLPATLKARVLSIQAMIALSFLAFILFTSNPFDRLDPAPLNGADLNPLLQDPGLAFHPPFLYLGYVGFSMAFSFSVAALIEGQVDSAWARWVRPWVLAAWCFLTIGITMGSWWAYYELGWGGWWFWDPVENASFMPWLVGTALLHSALVVERRQTMINWTILLGIVTFTLSLIGTFLVRSGVITSVHAFAVDPARGVFILAILFLAAGGALTLYAYRASALRAGPTFGTVSREGALVLNNIFLVIAAGMIFLGTFYPLFIDALGDDKISVGPPYFNPVFATIMIPMLIIMAFGPILKWRKDNLAQVSKAILPFAVIAFIILLLVALIGKSFFPALGMGLAAWLILGTFYAWAQKTRLGKVPFSESLRLSRLLPRSIYGLLIGHAAMGICVAGIVAMSFWASEDIRVLTPGQSFTLRGYEITLEKVTSATGPNYQADRAIIHVARHGQEIATLRPETRFYPVRQQQTSEAGIRSHPLTNIYIALGDPSGAGWVVRSYIHPMATLIWIGALLMAFGGFVSLSDRRFRLGARIKQSHDTAPPPPEMAIAE